MSGPFILGCDPGDTAAASLVDFSSARPTILFWWSWAWLKSKGGRFRMTTPTGAVDLRSMHEIGDYIRRDADLATPGVREVTVALEGLYIAAVRGRTKAARAAAAKKAQSMIPCAEFAGEIRGPLRALGPILRPTANDWLGALGLSSGMGSARLEASCLQEAKRRYEWPDGFPRLKNQREEVALAESAHMAAWAYGERCK